MRLRLLHPLSLTGFGEGEGGPLNQSGLITKRSEIKSEKEAMPELYLQRDGDTLTVRLGEQQANAPWPAIALNEGTSQRI
jgi:hypothetical protein